MAVGKEIVGIVQALIGWILAIVTCALPKWRVTAFTGSNIVTSQIIREGIWMSCVVQSSGQMQCKVYDSMLALSSDLQAARAMTVISIVTALLALIISIVSVKRTNCISGILFLIAGIILLIPVSWTSYTIMQDFYNPLLHWAQRRELGESLYIGFAAAALLIIGGGFRSFVCSPQHKSSR
ncbi:claudin-4-like [Colossoma macropomum]|uniref:claudin-4-like n=1 Tax=Colossoma macropomum TaxID=42526 RepID=UPI0018641CC7|nr:claudin-4-like [Colossoma macropomum]